MENSSIQECVASVDREVVASCSMLTSEEGKALGQRLNREWKKLVEALTLPPQPTRPCPTCGKLGMQEATLCGYCWTELASQPVSK